MKTLALLITIACLPLTLHAQSDSTQLTTTAHNAIRVSVVDFFMNTFYLEYERSFNNRTSFVVNGEIILGEEEGSEYAGAGVGAQYRIYSSELVNYEKYKVQGIYLGPYVHYRTIDLSMVAPAEDQHFTTFKAGVILGLQLTFFDKLNMDFSLGGGIQIANGSDSEDEYYYIFDLYEPDFTGIKPSGNITIGLKF